MRLGQLAGILGYRVIGDSDTEINSINYPCDATANSIVINYFNSDIAKLKAGAFLARNEKNCKEQNYLICSEITGVAAIKIVDILIKYGYYPDYSIMPQYTNFKNGIYIGKNFNIGYNTIIAPSTIIGDNVKIGSNCRIDNNVTINSGSIIGDNVIIRSGTRIGSDALYYTKFSNRYSIFTGVGIAIIFDNVEIGSNSIIQRGSFSNTYIAEGTKIGDLVDIGHDVKIGSDCRINSQTGIAGNVCIGDRVCVYGQVGISDSVTIGNDVTIMGKSVISKSIASNSIISGNCGWNHGDELRYQMFLRKQFKKR